MDLSVVTITWNSAAHTPQQISSVISACRDVTCEEIIVDNASRDQTVSIIQKFPSVKLIKNSRNLGFGHANNQAVKGARGEFILFLNPDMRLDSGSMAKWLAWMRNNPAVGISGCRLLNDKGELNVAATPRRFPTIWNQLAIILKIPHLFPGVLNHYLYRDKDFLVEQTVDSVRGACMLVRRELINKLGHAFDPRYFIWFEDVDLCREARRLGYVVKYTPLVSATDLVGASFKKRHLIWKQGQFILSMIKYFWKWGLCPK